MRDEISELLKTDWGRLPEGLGCVVRAVLKLRPTEEEMRELAAILPGCENENEAFVIIRIMRDKPREFFRGTLVRTMESTKTSISGSAARALLYADHEGAVDAVLASKTAIKALGDELPRKMLSYAEDLPRDKQKLLLDQFFQRLSDRPPLEAARDWFKMISMIPIQDGRLTPILWKSWQEMPKGMDWLYDRLALLDAMVTHPDPIFQPAFELAAKARDDDIKAIGKTGLYVLSEIAAGRWPFEEAG